MDGDHTTTTTGAERLLEVLHGMDADGNGAITRSEILAYADVDGNHVINGDDCRPLENGTFTSFYMISEAIDAGSETPISYIPGSYIHTQVSPEEYAANPSLVRRPMRVDASLSVIDALGLMNEYHVNSTDALSNPTLSHLLASMETVTLNDVVNYGSWLNTMRDGDKLVIFGRAPQRS